MPRFQKLSPEMQRWAAMLAEEVEQWPGVTTKPMFGLTGFYRGKTIFAAVPRSRCLGSSNSVIFKLPEGSKWREQAPKDPRIAQENMDTHKWFPFEIGSEGDLRDALLWFERAFQSAKSPRK
ncbi:MAG: hypothetical protein ACJ71N_09020 [Terriglobales bacterium]|jgi:hypothetical protein